MCGIIGALSLTGQKLDVSLSKIGQLMDEMLYRGPDAQGQWASENESVMFGHLRLSILDKTESGTQPMHRDSGCGKFSITFNGEVYNYIEVRSELIKLGYTFSTETDTEVILCAYMAWGEACLSKFNGMFAFAIYDHEYEKLFLARDRLGIKPVYYNHDKTSKTLSFASEVKSLRPIVKEDTSIDPQLLDQYMQFGYVPGEHTMNQGIKRLLPGHFLVAHRGNVSITKYWSLNFGGKDHGLEHYIEKGRELFSSSLDLRLRSDVPVGIFLSGGLDSSAVVGALASKVSEPLRTFSVKYDFDEFGEEYDESKYALQIAEKFGTIHKTITMTPADFEAYIPSFVKAMDEPVTEAAALSLHFVSELAKKDVTVVLSGEGSDEIFAGYDLYQRMMKIEMCRKLATPLGADIAFNLGKKLLPAGNKILKYLEMASKPFHLRYKGISVYEQTHKEKLYRADYKATLTESAPPAFTESLFNSNDDLLSQMLKFDTKTWLVDDLLTKADRMSMASSLELRVPFLDYRMVEFAASMPSKYKIQNGEGKFILKKMMDGLLPENIIYREKKGFPTPLKMMFMGPLKEYTKKTLLGENVKIFTYFNRDYVQALCDEHFDGKADHHRILWQLIVIEEWLKQNA